MQHSPVLLSSLTSLLGLDPSAAADARAREQQGTGAAGEDAFAVLLAAIGTPASGEVLPAGGNILPSGSATAPFPALADVRAATGAFPAAVPASVGEDGPAALRDVTAEPSHRAAQAPMPDDLLRAAGSEHDPAAETSSRAAEDALGSGSSAGSGSASPRESLQSQATLAAIDPERRPGVPVPAAASSPTPADPSAAPDPAPAETPAVRLRTSTGEAAAHGLDAAHDPAAGRTEQDAASQQTEAELDTASEAQRTLSRTPAASAGSDAGASTSATGGIAAPSIVAVDAGADVQPSSPARFVHDGGGDARGAPADLGDSVAGRIRVMIDHGAGEARLKLNPPELGTIDVRISMVDDKMFVQMTASHAAGRDALEQSLPRLRELLAAGGLDLGGASVDGGGRDARSESGPGRPDAPYTFVPEAAAEAGSASAGAHKAAAARGSGRIDLFA